jgi:ATP-dependent DNA helicase RecQ
MASNLRTDPLDVLQAAFGPQVRFRPGQLEAIHTAMKPGARLLLVQAAGWGKSAVYFLAAKLLREAGRGATLVVSPLIALMRNQEAAARRFGLRAAALHSGNRSEWLAIARLASQGELDLLFVSPERLHKEEFRSQILEALLPSLGLVVLDEAHCVSEWGHDFRPRYRTVLRELRGLPKEASILAATATATDRVEADLRALLGPFLEVQRGPLALGSLRLLAFRLEDPAERLAWLARYLPKLPAPGIVYALTVFDCMDVAQWLRAQGIAAESYHADLDGPRREELERRFLRNEIPALVSTTALGMGFDKADVGYVVHYQLPASLVAYYQQIGRAGRARERSYAALLFGGKDEEAVEALAHSSRPPRLAFEAVLKLLQTGPLEFADLQAKARMAPTALREVLDLLEAGDALCLQGSLVGLRMAGARREIEHGERVREQRRLEFKQVWSYALGEGCRMLTLAEALGESGGEPCGVCDRCKPIPEPHVDQKAVAAAHAHLSGSPKIIRPRTALPPGARQKGIRLGAELACLPGIALGGYGDAHWGRMVREGKYGEGRFSDALAEAARLAVEERGFRPDWICWMPSTRPNAPLPEFCQRLGDLLGVPARDVLERARFAPPQKTMRTGEEAFANVWGAIRAKHAVEGRALLVDDVVDSGWTLAAAGSALRQAGAAEVLPLALAAASSKRIVEPPT